MTEGQSSFTPGPWAVEDRRGAPTNRGGGALQIQASHRGEGSSYCIASVNFWENAEGNARLIAAAPRMYDLLHRLAERTIEYVNEEPTEEQEFLECDAEMRALAKEARALLAEARGDL